MSDSSANVLAGGFVLIFIAIAIVVVVLYVLVLWRILSKAGYSGALSLLVLIPGVGTIAGLILMIVLAFSEWPVYRELNALRAQVGYRPPFPGPGGPNPGYPGGPGMPPGGPSNPSYPGGSGPQYPYNQ
ncbi:MAG TPA: hypothetical protein VL461_00460 [Dictyobacter sp.]|jgi:heme/copper-type cytochrome/quinol oxidase subunit 2|nr:hypothetical protein [Dictyobacter sp.]